MAQPNHTQRLAQTEEALTLLFCLIDDAYALLNPRGQSHASLKKLSDSEIITLTLLQQLRGVQSERSFLRDADALIAGYHVLVYADTREHATPGRPGEGLGHRDGAKRRAGAK
jgi:hypothetical protein